ncbi:MAG: thiamine pyrophosphate-dependent enzyme [Candidatus Thorarchaeota archaeon]|jgi:indolepyruvate ferredoxin oxidoreductase alpha subunit
MDDETSARIMSGNEAMARGALEAGVGFCTSYPGTPATEIIEYIMARAESLGIHAEWSVNEKVAFEAAAAASWAGIPALCSMKSLGLNVASDSLLSMNLSGSGDGGFVIIVADDPRGHSTTTEQDSRFYAKAAILPLLEPSGYQEAKDVVLYAFDISKRFKVPVLIRSTTRLSHSRGLVNLGSVERNDFTRPLKMKENLFNVPDVHLARRDLKIKIKEISMEFDKSPFNELHVKKGSGLLTIASGICQRYAEEAVEVEGVGKASALGLVTTHPLPKAVVGKAIKSAQDILFLEESDPFLEDAVRAFSTELPSVSCRFHGKRNGVVPSFGELNVDLAIQAVLKTLGFETARIEENEDKIRESARELLIGRALTFCAGCTHRNVYWAVRKVKKRLGGKLFVAGDIGCYSLGVFYDEAISTLFSMGSGIGIAGGLGQLHGFGFDSRVAAVAGDSTFLHACIPALINARHKKANVTFMILDNSTIAMTGYQKHPGVEEQPEGRRRISIENIVQAINPDFYAVGDAADMSGTIDLIHDTIQKDGLNVLLFESICRLEEQRMGETYADKGRVNIESDSCQGESCKICAAQFGCVALGWHDETARPIIYDHVCVRCGACVLVCPHDAIKQG